MERTFTARSEVGGDQRVRRIKREETTETVCAVTSLGPERASAK